MNIPSFDEFYKTIGPDGMGEFFGGEPHEFYQIDDMTLENVAALSMKLYENARASSAHFSISLLRAYHNWLSKQLGQSLWDPQ